jgi:hypothetical protein
MVYTYMQGSQGLHEARVSGWQEGVPMIVQHETVSPDSEGSQGLEA